MINKGLWLCLLYVLLTFSAFAYPAPDIRASDYDLVQADNPSEPQVLARVEVPENLQSINLPVYAGLVDGSGVFYALVMASRNQLDTSGVSYRIIDICPSDVRYLLAFSRNPDHHEKGAFQIPVLYDDGRCIIVRDIDDADNILIDIGFELKLLSVEPMRLEPVEIDKTLAVGAVTPDSDVSKMLSQVDINAVTTFISNLSGASTVTIDGNPYTITTRRTDSGTPIQKATQYIINHLDNNGLTVSTHNWVSGKYNGRNIIGELKGKTNPGEIVIMVAHLDSISDKTTAPGADDNASGCAVLLAAADIMRNYSFERTIRFLFTTGEEQGLLGSYVYVNSLQGQKIVSVLNLDMTGYSTSGLNPPVQNIKTRNPKDPGNPADMVIANLYREVVASYGLDTSLDVKIRQDSDESCDQSSFWDRSIPAVLAIQDDYDNFDAENYHTENDTLSKLNMPYCTAVVKASLATVAHLAGMIGIIGPITLEAELQKMLDKAITDSTTHIPGAVLLLSTSSAQYVVAGGKSNLSSATAMKATDMLRIASMTKTFLSTVILKLREEGKLNLDDTVAKHLPETASKIANGQTATIRQLLNMSSGIFEYYDNPDYLKAVETRPSRQAWTPEEVIAYVYGQSAYFSPGTQFKYTNSNYILLEMIVNKVSNATLASEMRRIIFTPLGMDNTFMEMAETRAGGFGGLLVRGYDTTQNPAADITEKNDSLGLGDGGLISDVQGIDTFLRALFKKKTLLNEDSLSQMKTIGISGKEYGLGLEVKISSDYGTNWGHSGKTAGFQGEMRYFPDKDTTFAILTNEENSNSTFIDDVFKSSMRLLYPQNSITEFSAGITSNSGPWEIATGPDGNLWFTYINLTFKRNVIGKITPSGVVTEFFVDIGSDNRSWGITAGSDGNMWFTAPGYAFSDGMIVRISPSGAVAKFTDGITPLSSPQGITAGPDGNIWFAETNGNRIGRITPSGVVTEFSNGISPNSSPTSIVAGSDGNLWFTEIDGNRIGRITPSGDITEFSVGISPGSGPSRIASGPDGNLWFTESKGNRIGRITPSGVITEFAAGITPNSQLAGITTGPDGNVWFSEGVGRIGKITTSGVVTEFSAVISPNSEALGIVTGPDGNIWFTEPIGNRIGRVSEITTGCTAMLDSNFVLHIPILSNSDSAIGTVSLWADFVYKPDSANPTLLPLMLTTYGIINHPSFSCTASSLSGNLSIHIPDVLLSDQMTRMWMDLEYSPHLSISGKNYWYLKNFGLIIK